MSVLDLLSSLKARLNCFTRQSEYEQSPVLYEQVDGIWLDEFNDHWVSVDFVRRHLNNRKKVCIVSPELHKRAYKDVWQYYKDTFIGDRFETVMLCTDLPEEARHFFND